MNYLKSESIFLRKKYTLTALPRANVSKNMNPNEMKNDSTGLVRIKAIMIFAKELRACVQSNAEVDKNVHAKYFSGSKEIN